jgi:OFA family oxalate/formate antiporter-like MFS transporter
VLSATGGWNLVFIVAAVITIAAGISAKFILAPMRTRWVEASENPVVHTKSASRLSHWPEQTGE